MNSRPTPLPMRLAAEAIFWLALVCISATIGALAAHAVDVDIDATRIVGAAHMPTADPQVNNKMTFNAPIAPDICDEVADRLNTAFTNSETEAARVLERADYVTQTVVTCQHDVRTKTVPVVVVNEGVCEIPITSTDAEIAYKEVRAECVFLQL